MDIVKGVAVEGCSKHGDQCKCTPGIVTQDLELWAECGGDRHPKYASAKVTLVCCDNGHEFVFTWHGTATGRGKAWEYGLNGENQFGHVWTDTPRCRECCTNHGGQHG